MAKPERPKSRLADGRINPDYTAWRKANILKGAKAAITDKPLDPLPVESAVELRENLSDFQSGAATVTDEALAEIVAPFFQSAAEPENAPPGEVDSDAGSSPAPATLQEEVTSIVIEAGVAGVDDADDDKDIPTFTLGDGAVIEESPETLSLMVIREARNSKFVLCALDKRKVAVRLLKRGTGPKLIKKHIKVQCVRKNFIQVP